MTGYLLDTNVVSEFSKRSPSPHVVGFLEDTQADLWLSVIVLGELELGVQVLPEGRRRNRLSDWLSQLKVDFDQCVLPIESRDAEWSATFRERAHRDGWRLQLADALIAGTAKARDLVVATRNARDFAGLDVEVINPWNHR